MQNIENKHKNIKMKYMQNKESMHKELENVSIQDKYKINAKDKKHSKKNE